MIITNTERAAILGGEAFARGVPCIPVLDGEFRDTLKGRAIGDPRNEPEYRAWIAGWTEASLSA